MWSTEWVKNQLLLRISEREREKERERERERKREREREIGFFLFVDI